MWVEIATTIVWWHSSISSCSTKSSGTRDSTVLLKENELSLCLLKNRSRKPKRWKGRVILAHRRANGSCYLLMMIRGVDHIVRTESVFRSEMDAWERGAGGLYFIVWQPVVAAHNIIRYNGCRWREIKLRAPRRSHISRQGGPNSLITLFTLSLHLALRILHQLVQQWGVVSQ